MSKHVVIAGGGIAGLEAAIYLRKENFNVTLISDKKYLYLYPVSIWIPTKEITFNDACHNLYDLAKIHNFTFVEARVKGFDTDNNVVDTHTGPVCYDFLVIALGAGKMKPKGVENTLSICGDPHESTAIGQKLETLIERGHGALAFGFGGNPNDTSAVRGGPGFELIFNVHLLLKKKGIRDHFSLHMFAPMEKPGARMGEKALQSMDGFFKRLNIHTHFGKKIKMFENDGVIFEDGSKLYTDFTMFISAGNGHPVIRNSSLPQNEAGFITTDQYCKVVGYENIFAIGDSAAMQGPQWRAKQGHIAEVMARNTAHNIAVTEGKKGSMQSYIEHINILCVMDTGDGAAFVYRDDKTAKMIPMPIFGHWLKKGWGWYYKYSKRKIFPRLPGM